MVHGGGIVPIAPIEIIELDLHMISSKRCHMPHSCETMTILKDAFGEQLISRNDPVNWPPRSCDLTLLDYLL